MNGNIDFYWRGGGTMSPRLQRSFSVPVLLMIVDVFFYTNTSICSYICIDMLQLEICIKVLNVDSALTPNIQSQHFHFRSN